MKPQLLILLFLFAILNLSAQMNSNEINFEYKVINCELYLEINASWTANCGFQVIDDSKLRICKNPDNKVLYLLEDCITVDASEYLTIMGFDSFAMTYRMKVNDSVAYTAGLCQHYYDLNGGSLVIIDNCLSIVGGIGPYDGDFPSVYYDTVLVYDTIYTYETIPVYENIAVTDTLYIDVSFTESNSPETIYTITVYPNPARDILYISIPDQSTFQDYKLEIINQAGSIIFESIIGQDIYEIALSEWSGEGLYFLQLRNPLNELIEVKKIVLW